MFTNGKRTGWRRHRGLFLILEPIYTDSSHDSILGPQRSMIRELESDTSVPLGSTRSAQGEYDSATPNFCGANPWKVELDSGVPISVGSTGLVEGMTITGSQLQRDYLLRLRVDLILRFHFGGVNWFGKEWTQLCSLNFWGYTRSALGIFHANTIRRTLYKYTVNM